MTYRKHDQIVVCDCCSAKPTAVDLNQQQHNEHSDLNNIELNNQQLQPPDSFAYREANRKFSNLVSRIL